VAHQCGPVERPAERANQFARQAEWKVERTDPRTRLAQQSLEGSEAGQCIDAQQRDARPCTLPRATVIGFLGVGALVKSTPTIRRASGGVVCDGMHGL